MNATYRRNILQVLAVVVCPLGTAAAQDGNFLDRITLRKDLKDAKVKKDENAKAEGAQFSYTQDNVSDSDQWLVRGALVYQQGFPGNPDASSWSAAELLAAVALDKVETSGGSKGEVDSLTFTGGLGWEFLSSTGSVTAPGLTLTADASYNTNTDLDHGILKGSLDLLPQLPIFGVNSGFNNRIAGVDFPFVHTYAIDLGFHAEGGSVLDDGDSAKLMEDDFVRLGGFAGITVWPKFVPDHNLSLSAKILHYETVVSDLDSPSYYELEARWRLLGPSPGSEDQSATKLELTVNYRNGKVEDTLQDVDLLSIGFALAY